MVKGFRQIAILTALSRVLGMLRDMAFAYFLGAGGLMKSWVIAFMIPNLSRRLFGEGAASASFIPVYSEQLKNDPQAARKLAGTMVSVVFVILSVVVLIGWAVIWAYSHFFASVEQTRTMLALIAVMLPYMVMICTVAILAGVLQVHRHFAAPAAAPIVLNIFIITATVIAGTLPGISDHAKVFTIAGAVLAAGVAQLVLQLVPMKRAGVSLRPTWEVQSAAFKKIIILMGPMIIGLTVTQVNTLFDVVIAACLSGSDQKGEFFTFLSQQIKFPLRDGAVSYLYYSQRLYQLPLGIFGISLATAIFPIISENAANKDYDALRKTVAKGIKGALFISIPAAVGLLIVVRPMVSAIFEHGKFDTAASDQTARTLLFYAPGLVGFFCQQILTRAFYAMKDSITPMKSAVAALAVNLILNLVLVWFMGTGGLALSTTLCSYLQVVVLLFCLRKRFGNAILEGLWGWTGGIAKTAAAAVVMFAAGFGVMFLMRNLPTGEKMFDIIRLAVTIPVSAVVFGIASKLMENESMSLLTGAKQRK